MEQVWSAKWWDLWPVEVDEDEEVEDARAAEMERVTEVVASSGDPRPFGVLLPGLKELGPLLLGAAGWEEDEDFPADRVCEEVPPCFSLKSEKSVCWLVRLTPETRLDLGLKEVAGRETAKSRVWDVLPPYTTSRVVYYDAASGSFIKGKQFPEEGYIVKVNKKRMDCDGAAMERRACFVQKKQGDSWVVCGLYALVQVQYVDKDAEPRAWDFLRGSRADGKASLLRTKPSVLGATVAKVKEYRSLSQAKEAQYEEMGGLLEVGAGQQLSAHSVKKAWAAERKAEGLPGLGRGGQKAHLDDAKLRAAFNRNSDVIWKTQMEVDPEDGLGYMITMRNGSLSRDDIQRCLLTQTGKPEFRSPVFIDTSFGDTYVTAIAFKDPLFLNEAGVPKTTVAMLALHDRRSFTDYQTMSFYFGLLSGIRPEKQKEDHLYGYVTDGDVGLVGGLSGGCDLFAAAPNVGCFLHLDGNIRSKLDEDFPALKGCKSHIVTSILGVEFKDGRVAEGGAAKRTRLQGLVDVPSTEIRTEWAELKDQLADYCRDRIESVNETAEAGDERLAQFLAFAEHFELNTLPRIEQSFSLTSRDAFCSVNNNGVTVKATNNPVEGIWPGIREAVTGMRSLHEIVTALSGWLRREGQARKAAVLGTDSQHVRLAPAHAEQYRLSVSDWLEVDTTRQKRRLSLGKVWRSLKTADECGGLQGEEEAPDLDVCMADLAIPSLKPQDKASLDRAVSNHLKTARRIPVAASWLTLVLSENEQPLQLRIQDNPPMLKCSCPACIASPRHHYGVTAHTLTMVNLMDKDFQSEFIRKTNDHAQASASTERAGLVSPSSGKKGPMAVRRHAGASSQRKELMLTPDRVIPSTPSHFAMNLAKEYCNTLQILMPDQKLIASFASQSRSAYQPQVYRYHNKLPFTIYRLKDLSDKILSGYRQRDCAACLRKIMVGMGEDPTNDAGDLVMIHEEVQLKRVEGAGFQPPPELPPPATMAIGLRHKAYETGLQLAGWRWGRAGTKCLKALHAHAACWHGRYPYAERAQILVAEKSRPFLSPANRAFLSLQFGLPFQRDDAF